MCSSKLPYADNDTHYRHHKELQNSKYNEKGCTKELQIVLPFNIMKNKKFQLQTNERHL